MNPQDYYQLDKEDTLEYIAGCTDLNVLKTIDEVLDRLPELIVYDVKIKRNLQNQARQFSSANRYFGYNSVKYSCAMDDSWDLFYTR